MFEAIRINAGVEPRWEPIGRAEWVDAHIAAYHCRFELLTALLDRARPYLIALVVATNRPVTSTIENVAVS